MTDWIHFFISRGFRSTLPSFVTNNTLSTRLGNGTGSGNGGNMSINRGLIQHGTSGTNNRSSPNSSSAYSSNLTQQQVWRTQKPDGLGGPFGGGAMGSSGLGARCTWKFVAIFFMLLSVILVSALIYSTGKWLLKYISSFHKLAILRHNYGKY